ncbi:DUF4232 domain-containing protein [Streptomyces sp. ISL-43]|uniref:DUF4232 domain-containing protein n=1 Tax=Streptomyces sp. ISL-43 TaxID=2819183 RepID=UPI001BE9378C|nr:DUF4232 domain-containing protein [Streptomyces sp. ISL-43]MBT2451423.1 DUF4232 domain-containing protein [Streptomyces sp. ISL-43]
MNAGAGEGHRSWKAYVLGSAAVVALLASTACGPSATDGSDDRKPSDQPSTRPSPGSSNTGGSGDSATAACAESDLSVSATNEDKQGEPVEHLLLTVTNTGDKTCNVYRYPSVLLGADAQAMVAVIEDSDPKKLATLAPGKQAHAALLVRGGHMDEYQANIITFRLQGPELGGNGSKPIKVDLPGLDKLWADDGARVTYWTTASGHALDFIMSS